MWAHIVSVLSAGGESPLAPESNFGEIMRIIGPLNSLILLYVLKLLKELYQNSGDTHGQIIRDIAEGKENIDKGRKEISTVRHDVKNLRQELIAAGFLKAPQ